MELRYSSIAQIEKSEHMWLMQFNSIINDIRMKLMMSHRGYCQTFDAYI